MSEEAAQESKDESEQSRRIFEQHCKAARIFGLMNGLENASASAFCAKSFPPKVPRSSFEHSRYPQHQITPRRLLKRRRMKNVNDALVHRHSPADRKDQHTHNQRPKVQFMSVAQRVIGNRGLQAPPHAKQNQPAVTSVDHRVDRLRQ